MNMLRKTIFAALLLVALTMPSAHATTPDPQVVTPPSSKILYFETGDTQWLFVSGQFTFGQALKMPLSVPIRDHYGNGWLLAPMLRPDDFSNAAWVIKQAQGDLRGQDGPLIGVIQPQGSDEPRGGFVNIDGSTPFVTWGKYDPNDGAPVHRNILRETAFQNVLKGVASSLVGYFTGEQGDKVVPIADKAFDWILGEFAKPEGGQHKEDVVTLFHDKSGRVVAQDSSSIGFYNVLLSRRKPSKEPPGCYVKWPTVHGGPELKDGMKIARRSSIDWQWSCGSRLGNVEIINLGKGTTEISRINASTPRQDLQGLRPGKYLLRLRNASRLLDPWLEIGFRVI